MHYECYHHACEPSCKSTRAGGDDATCPALDGDAVCFPGCFCPNGLVRDGNRCKEPAQCMNCVCRKQGSISYASFDDRLVKMEAERTYIMSRVPNQDGGFDLEVLGRTRDCSAGLAARKKVCFSEVEAKFAGHALKVQLVKGENYVSIFNIH